MVNAIGECARQAPRIALDERCEVLTSQSELPAILRCLDLSTGGARIASGIAPRVGELVVLALTPPGADEELVLFAEVRHVMRRGRAVRGFGVAFRGVTEPERQVIGAALAGVQAPGDPGCCAA